MVFLRCRRSSDFTGGNTEFKEMSFSLNFRRVRILHRLFDCIPSALYLVLSCCLVAKLCLTHCNLRDCSTPGSPVLHYLPGFAQTHVHWDNDAIQPSHLGCPLLLLPSIFPSIWVFSSELAFCIRCPKYWSFSFGISPSSEYSELISFRIDWFDLLEVQETLKSLLQHHSSKASILWHSVSWFNCHICTWLLEKNHSFDYMDLCWQSNVLAFFIYYLGLS